jgi:hypothetical protein
MRSRKNPVMLVAVIVTMYKSVAPLTAFAATLPYIEPTFARVLCCSLTRHVEVIFWICELSFSRPTADLSVRH